MITVIRTGSNVTGMVKYNHDKTKDVKDASLLGTINFQGDSQDSIVKEILNYNSRNNSITKPNLHISLSFSSEESNKATSEKMYMIAQEYMDNMGYGNQPYAIYEHKDRPHPHVHIVSTRITSDGSPISDSKNFIKSLKVSRDIEIKHNLIVATETKKKAPQFKDININGTEGLSHYCSNAIEMTLNQFPTNYKEFDYNLNKHKIKRVEGDNGIFYKFQEEENKPILKPGDLFEKYDNFYLTQQFQINKARKSKEKKLVQGKTHSILRTLKGPINLNDLKILFQKKGITLELKYRESGEQKGLINGVIFKHKSGKSEIPYSASYLGIKSIDFIKDYIKSEDHYINNENIKEDITTLNDVEQSTDNINIDSDNASISNVTTLSDKYDSNGLLEQLLDVLLEQSNGLASDDNQSELKKKKRKKRKKGNNM